MCFLIQKDIQLDIQIYKAFLHNLNYGKALKSSPFIAQCNILIESKKNVLHKKYLETSLLNYNPLVNALFLHKSDYSKVNVNEY